MKKNILLTTLIFIILISCKQLNQKDKIIVDNNKLMLTRFCFIHDVKIEGDNVVMLFDEVEYNDDTSLAKSKIMEMPNGYFFSDNEKKIEAINIDSSSAIIMQTFSFNEEGNFNFNQKVNIAELIEALNEKPISRFKQIPFRLVSTGTKVDSIIEIYIP